MAERYGFNHEPGIPGAVESTLPAASQIQGELDRRLDRDRPGRGAGQRPADGDGRGHDRRRRAQTAADVRARRRAPHGSDGDQRRRGAHGAAPDDRGRARRHRHLGGDPRGDGRRQDGHRRTGTARLAPAAQKNAAQEDRGNRSDGLSRRAPAKRATPTPGSPRSPRALHPRIVVCVLLVKDGAGGDTAAPVAREVLEAGLRAAALTPTDAPQTSSSADAVCVGVASGRRSAASAAGCRARRPGSCRAAARPGWGRRRRSCRAPAPGRWRGRAAAVGELVGLGRARSACRCCPGCR